MSRGGARKGAGRPKGEPTRAIRLPISVIRSIQKFPIDLKFPLYGSKVNAGFPSPADDHVTDSLNLNEYLIKHPSATFLVRATGNSMLNAGIHENDLLIVDRSISPTHGKIVVAAIDGQLTIKRLHKQSDGKFILMPDNPDYLPIEIPDGSDTYIWGVVTNVIHTV